MSSHRSMDEVPKSKAEKRLARKEAQKTRKVARKQAEQTENFSHVLAMFGPPAQVRRRYRVLHAYSDLPMDPAASPLLVSELSRVIHRPPKYHAKYAAQELALLRLALPVTSRPGVGVVDIGAGNANLACLLNMLFQVPVLCVDRDPPPPMLSADTRLPPNQVKRIEADICDLRVDHVLAWAHEHSLSGVLVLAKHLCGLGTDLAIEFCAALKRTFPVVGIVAATCCCNKLLGNDAARFSQLYSSEDPEFVPEKIETMAKCSGYRNNAQSQYARATPEMVLLAEAFEDALQAPRQRKLAGLFGCCEERQYVPSSLSLQNRVLLAGDLKPECKCALGLLSNGPDSTIIHCLRSDRTIDSSMTGSSTDCSDAPTPIATPVTPRTTVTTHAATTATNMADSGAETKTQSSPQSDVENTMGNTVLKTQSPPQSNVENTTVRASVCECLNKQLLAVIQRRQKEEGSRWPLDFRPLGFGSAKFDYDGT